VVATSCFHSSFGPSPSLLRFLTFTSDVLTTPREHSAYALAYQMGHRSSQELLLKHGACSIVHLQSRDTSAEARSRFFAPRYNRIATDHGTGWNRRKWLYLGRSSLSSLLFRAPLDNVKMIGHFLLLRIAPWIPLKLLDDEPFDGKLRCTQEHSGMPLPLNRDGWNYGPATIAWAVEDSKRLWRSRASGHTPSALSSAASPPVPPPPPPR
jgi:hypothetical protein